MRFPVFTAAAGNNTAIQAIGLKSDMYFHSRILRLIRCHGSTRISPTVIQWSKVLAFLWAISSLQHPCRNSCECCRTPITCMACRRTLDLRQIFMQNLHQNQCQTRHMWTGPKSIVESMWTTPTIGACWHPGTITIDITMGDQHPASSLISEAKRLWCTSEFCGPFNASLGTVARPYRGSVP